MGLREGERRIKGRRHIGRVDAQDPFDEVCLGSIGPRARRSWAVGVRDCGLDLAPQPVLVVGVCG